MGTPYTPAPFIQITPSILPQTPTPATRGRGAKRGRKPRGAVLTSSPVSHQANAGGVAAGGPAGASVVSLTGPQFTPVQWASLPTVPTAGPSTPISVSTVPTPAPASQPIPEAPAAGPSVGASDASMDSGDEVGPSTLTMIPPGAVSSTPAPTGATTAVGGSAITPKPGAAAGDEDGEGEDELLPAMADDDYSAQLSWQSESKDNLKVLMDNFSPAQYDRFEAYRRHALPKQAVRRVIQQTTGQQVSQPVAQIVAGFAKVFVGEIVENARAVQARRGETGPLSPDHLREAYRLYQGETGRVGSARAGRGRKLFVR